MCFLVIIVDNYKDVLPFWAFVTFLNLSIIYYFVIRNKIFTPMTERKWKNIVKSLIYTIPITIFLVVYGWHRPWLHQEEITNLQKEEGIVRIVHFRTHNPVYLETSGGRRVIELVYPFSFELLKSYEGRHVIIWRKTKYVYQLEVEEEVVFSIDEANNGLLKYNLDGIFLDLVILSIILWCTFFYVYTNK